MIRWYVLEGKTPVPCDARTWARWYSNVENHVVTRTTLGDGENEVRVSTMFLGLDSTHKVPPELFATLVLNGPLAGHMERYATWEEAEAGHERAVALARAHMRGS
jgi:hypothetical protein